MAIQSTLSWEVMQRPVYANDQVCPGFQALLRSDNGQLLNIAKTSYTPTSNARLSEVAHRLADLSGFVLEGFDTFQGGRKVLAYLKNNQLVKVLNEDGCRFDFDDYMVIGNSHDYSTGFFIGTCSVMLRCSNQFSRINQQMKVHHTRNHDSKINELLLYFQRYLSGRDFLFTKMEEFAGVRIDESIIAGLIYRLLQLDESRGSRAEAQPVLSTRKANIKDAMEESIWRECDDIGKNLLGLFNGITHYTTHVKKSREKVFGNVLGNLATLNEQAFRFCDEVLQDYNHTTFDAG